MSDSSSVPIRTGTEAALDNLACPNCSERLVWMTTETGGKGQLECQECAFGGQVVDGIPSFLPDAEGSHHPDERVLEEIATETERTSIREATGTLLADHEANSELASELFDVERDSWRIVVDALVDGRCLDLHAGFGRRSMLLSELADTVYAVDPTLSKLRVAAVRDDYETSDRVVPVHADENRLPFADGTLDTVVADLTTDGVGSVRDRIERLEDLLAADGSLVGIVDGWPRRVGLTGRMGLESRRLDATRSRELFPTTASGYRSAARKAGFDHVDVYALFPTASNPAYVFNVENQRAVRLLSDLVGSRDGLRHRLARSVLKISDATGVLQRCYPSYLLVCSNERSRSSVWSHDPLVVSGRARSVVLEPSADGLERVRKAPNRSAHEPFTEREHAVLSALDSSVDPIMDTLPESDVSETRVGIVRTEPVVDERSLANEFEPNADGVERVLRLGFDWLVEFQRTFGTDPVERSPVDVRADLRFEPAGIEPPPIDGPIRTFSTPAHGDFMMKNVYCDEDEVTRVIDWEYGALETSPIVDAGFLVLDTVNRCVDSFQGGVETILRGDSPLGERVRACVKEYCRAVEIPYRTFETYLPAAYLHRLELDWELEAVSTYTERSNDRARAVEKTFDAFETNRSN